MLRDCCVLALLATGLVLAGCGGGSPPGPAPAPPTAGDAGVVQVGPMLIRPASTARFTAQHLDSRGRCAFVALSGARIDYMASQALLDRVVFGSNRDGHYDIWVSNLDGSGVVQLTNNNAAEWRPQWSHDGTRIVFDRRWPGQDAEIMTMSAAGSSVTALTNDATDDVDPTWSHDSRRIAFQSERDGNWEIYLMFANGSSQTNLTNAGCADRAPSYSPDSRKPEIAFASDRYGDFELFSMGPDGLGLSQLTTNSEDDMRSAWHPYGWSLVADRELPTASGGDWELFAVNTGSGTEDQVSNDPDADYCGAWSTDGNWFAYTSHRSGDYRVWVQEVDEPYRAYQVSHGPGDDWHPHLGSPSIQTERVLIGPAGSDWGGLDPIWSTAYAGIVVFDRDGYRNFVRIGVRTDDLDSLRITPLLEPASAPNTPRLAGVLIEANEIVNLREDVGRGYEPTVWDLDPLNPGAVVLYFDTEEGRLVSALAVNDSTYPSAAASTRALTVTSDGAASVVRGAFSGVFDARGHNLAPAGAARVAIDNTSAVTVLD